MELFPSEYIHIGGDEAGKSAWRDCAKCRERMRSEGLKDVDELQSYLIHRIERFLNAHGRRLLGWDEILDGGLAPGATVMSWRGTEGGPEGDPCGAAGGFRSRGSSATSTIRRTLLSRSPSRSAAIRRCGRSIRSSRFRRR